MAGRDYRVACANVNVGEARTVETARCGAANSVRSIARDLRQIESTRQHGSGTFSTDGNPANVPERASKCAIVHAVVTESSEAYKLSNVVETALAKALLLAVEGERWDIVARIADELESRRGERLAGQNAVRACGNR